ncbi:hypothetical protein FB45DRAFT_872385 [Roridomyces roridus]|uniref:Uncharacterized protein n=1 Tax=Roridomyces roridus TaxID=1738132 RepID=A0AAD7BDP3_9AGAR|nr:hypothetical protein FB45DRAFT_872385 [Roridomyces roridus]
MSARTEIWNKTQHRLVASGVHIKMQPSAPAAKLEVNAELLRPSGQIGAKLDSGRVPDVAANLETLSRSRDDVAARGDDASQGNGARGVAGGAYEAPGVVDWIAGMARPVPEAMPSNTRRTRNFRNGRGTNRGRPQHNRPTEIHNDRGEVVGHRWSPAVQHYLDDRMVWTETAARGPSPSRSTHSSMPSLVDIETPTTGTTSAVTERPVEGVIDYEDEYDSAQNPTEPKEAHWSEVQTPWTAVDATVISTGVKTA